MASTRVEAAEPPMPEWGYRVVNPAVRALLQSPLHGLASEHLCVLRVTGRKSGRTYEIPVGYEEDGADIYVTTQATWAVNLRGGAPLAICLRGAWHETRGEAIEDPERVAAYLAAWVEAHGVDAAPRAGVRIDGETVPEPAAFREAAREITLLRIDHPERGERGDVGRERDQAGVQQSA
jgi:hypothetical protein